jgi:hypothetical protein
VQEDSGSADARPGQSPQARREARDAPIQRYFQEQLLPTLLATDGRDKLLSLTRELCALKVVEAQQQASLAAASRRADASLLQGFSLQQELQACQARLAALQAGGGPDAPEAALSLQVGPRAPPAGRMRRAHAGACWRAGLGYAGGGGAAEHAPNSRAPALLPLPQVAQLTAEGASRAAQVHQLQDRLLQAEQLLEAR